MGTRSKKRGVDDIETPASNPEKRLKPTEKEPKKDANPNGGKSGGEIRKEQAKKDENPKGGNPEKVKDPNPRKTNPAASKVWCLLCHNASHLTRNCTAKAPVYVVPPEDYFGWLATFKAVDEGQVMKLRSEAPKTVKGLMLHLQLLITSMYLLRKSFIPARDQLIKAIADNEEIMSRVNGRQTRVDNGLEEYEHYYSQAACLTDAFISHVITICSSLFSKLVTSKLNGEHKQTSGETGMSFRARASQILRRAHTQSFEYDDAVVQNAIDAVKKSHTGYMKKLKGREAMYLRLTIGTTLNTVDSRVYRLPTSYVAIRMEVDQSVSFLPYFPDISYNPWPVKEFLDESKVLDEDANYKPVSESRRSKKDSEKSEKDTDTMDVDHDNDVDNQIAPGSVLEEFVTSIGATLPETQNSVDSNGTGSAE